MSRLILSLVFCGLALTACSKDDKPATAPGGPGVVNPPNPPDPKPEPPVTCENPFSQVGQIVNSYQLVRPAGNWVLVKKVGYMETNVLMPTPDVYNSLNQPMRQQLLQIINNPSQITMWVDLAQLPWKTLYAGPINVPHHLVCTSQDDVNNYTQITSHDLSISLPYLLDARNLYTILGISSRMRVKDGITQSFQSRLTGPTMAMSSLETVESKTMAVESGPVTAVSFRKISDTRFIIRVESEQRSESTIFLTYTHPQTGTISRNIKVPLSTLVVSEGTFDLKN